MKQKYRKMVPLRENERGMMEGWSDYRQTLLRLCVVVIFRFELLGRIISSSSPYILRYHHTVIFFFFFLMKVSFVSEASIRSQRCE